MGVGGTEPLRFSMRSPFTWASGSLGLSDLQAIVKGQKSN